MTLVYRDVQEVPKHDRARILLLRFKQFASISERMACLH